MLRSMLRLIAISLAVAACCALPAPASAAGPTVAFSDDSPAANGFVREAVTYRFSSPAPGAQLFCSVNSPSLSPCPSGEVAVTPAAHAPFAIVRIQARSASGEAGTVVERQLTIDTTAPVTTIAAPKATMLPRPRITWTVADNDLIQSPRCTLALHDGPPAEVPCIYGSWQPDQDLPEGTHRLSVSNTDRAGNVESPAATATFTVDRTPPSLGSLTYAGGRVTFAAAGNVATTCAVDGAPEKACSSPFDVAGPAPGPHRVTVRVVDLAGNAKSESLAFTVPEPPAGEATPSPAPVTEPAFVPPAPPAPPAVKPAPGAAKPSVAKNAKRRCAAPKRRAKGRAAAKARRCAPKRRSGARRSG